VQYETLTPVDRETLLQELDAMPNHLWERFASLSAGEATLSGPGGGFSPVEQCWHLADLEREGFGVRIGRLRRSLVEGIQAFREARAANLALIRSVASAPPTAFI